MNTPPGHKLLVLNKAEHEKYALEQGWTTPKQIADGLGLDKTSVHRVLNRHDDRVGMKYLAHLVAHAKANGMSNGEAFERFIAIRDEAPLVQDAA